MEILYNNDAESTIPDHQRPFEPSERVTYVKPVSESCGTVIKTNWNLLGA